MPADPATGGAPRTKMSTRTSIRQSLNLSSVGKALGDIINKDSEKSRRSKEANSRRLSAINLVHATSTSSRSSLDSKPSPLKGGGTPESKTITSKNRRASGAHKQISEHAEIHRSSPTLLDSVPPQRHSSEAPRYPLRSRSSLASSALPKYRPKSVLVDSSSKQPPSPLRAGTRRRLSHSDDERDKPAESKSTPKTTPRSSTEKMAKPISPLPHRATFRVNVTAVNVSPPKEGSPLNQKISPPRPMKAAKTMVSSSAAQSAIPRPPSSASSVGSTTPRTPKTSGLRSALGLGKKTSQQSSPLRDTIRLAGESPLGRRTQKLLRNESSKKPKGPLVSSVMSHISEGDAEDSDEADDVELLLAPFASPTAPTPAMPRIRTPHSRIQSPPRTPSRANTLPTRADLSYRSPAPPDNENAPPCRPPQNDVARTRGSILSWEQLTSQASTILGDGEVDNMLSDIPAPFNAEPVSLDPLSMPGSPCLSALHSPDRFGSISQILLPDVTPSPAGHHTPKFDSAPTELLAVDSAIVTLLRLQLAAAENIAKERLHRLQSLEEEIHDLKDARQRDAEESARTLSKAEEQLRWRLEAREKADKERAAYISALEEQVRHDQDHLEETIEKAKSSAQQSHEAVLRSQRRRWENACSARDASVAWSLVYDIAENERDRIRADAETLAVLLASLDDL